MINSLFAILLAGILPFADTVSNRVWMGSSVQTGEFRNVFDAATQVENRLGAQGTASNGRLLMNGRFEYGYDYGTGSRYRGWTDPYSTPFMVCDTIPGNISKETYDMAAGTGVRFGRWTVGVDMGYSTATMSKHKDLRNKNVRMDFSFAPGVSYRGERFLASVSAGHGRGTEQVEYMQVDESTEKYLFQVYGLWLCTGSGFSSSENRRIMEENRLFANIDIRYKYGKALYSNSLSASYRRSCQTETGYNNLHHGDTHTLEYNDALRLSVGPHAVAVDACLQQMVGSRKVQRQELDHASGVRRWFSYGAPSDVYWRQVLKLDAAYTYTAPGWNLEAGVFWLDADHAFKEYPVVYGQTLSFVEPRLALGWTISCFRIAPSIAWKHSLSENHLSTNVFGGVSLEAAERQLTSPLKAEYAYWSADAIRTGMCIEVWRALRNSRQLTLGLGINCHYNTDSRSSRTAINILIGYCF